MASSFVKSLDNPSKEEILNLIAYANKLKSENDELKDENEELRNENEELRRKIDNPYDPKVCCFCGYRGRCVLINGGRCDSCM